MILIREAMKKIYRLTRIALGVTVAATFIGGCTPTHNVHGNMVQDYQLTEVATGQDSRTDVLRKLGSPTTKAPFNDNVWYYLGQKMEKRGILDSKVTEERIVVVSFDEDGIVQNIEDIDNERIALPYERGKTPTSGNEMTVLQQLLGNLGKFNREETE